MIYLCELKVIRRNI